jgi:hypothetical protein
MLGGIVKGYPAQFFLYAMRFAPRHLIFSGCLLVIACIQLSDAAEPGYLEGQLKIGSRKEVELAEAGPSKHREENYPDYPLVILSKAGQKEVARVTPDQEGNYRVALPPGDYILDVEARGQSHVRAQPQPFTIVSNQTVRVDMNIDTGIR